MAENAEVLQGISTSLNTVVEKLSEKKEPRTEPSLTKMIQFDQLIGAVKSIDKKFTDVHERLFRKNKLDDIVLKSAEELGEINDSLKAMAKKASDTKPVATKQTPVETPASKPTETAPTKKASFWESASISSKFSSVASKAKGAFSLAKPKDRGAKKLSPFGLTVKTLLSSIDASLSKLTKLTEKSDADKFLAAEDRKKKGAVSIETKKTEADKKKETDKSSSLLPMTMQKWALGMLPSIITFAAGAFMGYTAGMMGGVTAEIARVGRTLLQAPRVKSLGAKVLSKIKPGAKTAKAGFNKATTTFVTKQAATATKRTAPKMAARAAGKVGARAGKLVPLLGIGIGVGLTAARITQALGPVESDIKFLGVNATRTARGFQAAGEAASTIAVNIPIAGTAVAGIIDAANIWTDNIIDGATKNSITLTKADKAQIQYSQNLEKLSSQLAGRVARGEITETEAKAEEEQIKYRKIKERKTNLAGDLAKQKETKEKVKNRGWLGKAWNEVTHVGGLVNSEEYYDEKAAASASGYATNSTAALHKARKRRSDHLETNPNLEKNIKAAREIEEKLAQEQQMKNDALMNEQIAAARESTAQGKLMVKILQDTYKKPPVVIQHQLGPDLYPNATQKAY